MDFTHQGAHWSKHRDLSGVEWLGTPEEKERIARDLDRVQAWAEQHSRPILLGEFGAYDKADYDSRVRWPRFLAREAEKRDIDWAYWEFGSGFGIFDIEENKWDLGLLNALIPPKKAKLRR